MKALKFIVEANKIQVRRMLGWTELQYAEFVETKGIEYLKNILFADDWSIGQLTKSKLWWAWWKNHWHKRDEEFLLQSGLWTRDTLLSEYSRLHTVNGDLYPNNVIMERSYAILIEGINKQAVADGLTLKQSGV